MAEQSSYDRFKEVEQRLGEALEAYDVAARQFNQAWQHKEDILKQYREVSKNKAIIDWDEPLYNADPNCKHEVEMQWSGVKCRKCAGWYCA